ncbi:MAG: hypothetical protein ACRC92_20345 [Peptostreptococcaceae bacterium]
MKKILLAVLLGATLMGCNSTEKPEIDRRGRYQSSADILEVVIGPEKLSLEVLESLEVTLEVIRENNIKKVGEKAYYESGESYQYARTKENILVLKNKKR